MTKFTPITDKRQIIDKNEFESKRTRMILGKGYINPYVQSKSKGQGMS